MALQENLLIDGFTSQIRGMNSGVSADFLSPLSASFAVNAVARGGYYKPRPGWKRIDLDFTSGDVRDDFKDELFQQAEAYDTEQGHDDMVLLIGGKLFRIDIKDRQCVDISISGDFNHATLPKAWMYQAETNLIVQNGQDPPMIHNGASTRRAAPGEVPCGTVGVYGMGRIWQTLRNERSFWAGDLVYSNGSRDDVLKGIENTFLAEGGVFGVPGNVGKITAMKFPAMLDTSLGNGPLQVFTTKSIFSVNAPIDRTTWQNLSYPIQTYSMLKYGAVNQDCVVEVNGDLYFRCRDKSIRSFYTARRNFGQPANTPLSTEMNRVLRFDDPKLLEFTRSILFDNRLLMTCSPVRTQRGVYHRGVVSLDFDPLSSMASKEPPAYDSVWTDYKVLKLITLEIDEEERAFAIVLNDDLENELWEITASDKFDNDDTRITWYFEAGSFSFLSPINFKNLNHGQVGIDELAGQCDFDVKFRPDGLPYWINWDSWSECATYKDCTVDPATGCPTLETFQSQYRPRHVLPLPPDSCEESTGIPHRIGKRFQPRIQVTGHCRIKEFAMMAAPVDPPPMVSCPQTVVCKEVTTCPGADFISPS